MRKTAVKIRRVSPEAVVPEYRHDTDAGADVCSTIDCTLKPRERVAVPTGLVAEVPPGFELQVRPRSGLALRNGIAVLNAPGTIDAGYRGEIKVILMNLGDEPFEIRKGDRIAQLVLAPVVRAEFREVKKLARSRRGDGGFGSTGR